MITQRQIIIKARKRGCHLITDEVKSQLELMPERGILNLFVQHTSCGITLNENADPSVREDMNNILDKFVPENEAYYTHTLEGSDDMPAHVKSSLMGVTLSIPITNYTLNLGTWQGIYLCEFRNNGGNRNMVATIIE